MTLSVALVGSESAATEVLRLLDGHGHDIAAVLVEQPSTTGSGLAQEARRFGVEPRPAKLVSSPLFARWLRNRDVDLLLNVHSLTIIDGSVTSAPRIGCFNLHPGPLPEYAGLNVVTWAIARGETSHGVTLHWMDRQVDTGDIAYDHRFPVTENDTGLSVFRNCVRHGVGLVEQLLEQAADDPTGIPRRPQPGPRTMYRSDMIPEQGLIRWGLPARRIHDLVRANNFAPFASPFDQPVARHRDRAVRVVRTHLTGEPTDDLPGTLQLSDDVRVATGDDWLGIDAVDIGDGSVDPRDALDHGLPLEDGRTSHDG